MTANHLTSLSDRISRYYQQSRSIPSVTGALTVGSLAWQLTMPQSAEAAVNTFTFAGTYAFNRAGLGGSGPDGSRFRAIATFNFFGAYGAGQDYVGGNPLPLSATISTFNNLAIYTGAVGLFSGQLLPMRVTTGGGANYFGWISRLGNNYVVGFSDRPNTGVLAGTTTEVGVVVPEPGTALPLLLLGSAGIIASRRRKR